MHAQNHFAGQAQVFARYAGLNQIHPPRIRGRLQFDYADLGPAAPLEWHFGWSDSARRRGKALGRRHQFTIGAAWLYLLELAPATGSTPRSGTLWFPTGDPERLIREIKATETGPVTVCLDPSAPAATRAAYERAGFSLLEYAATEPVDYDRPGGGPMTTLLAAFRKHERVASDVASTPVLYGIAAGCEPAVYGGTTPATGVLAGPKIDLTSAREIADHELGRAWMVPPGELRRLFDWRERV
ncbi:hypothetical protein [Kribbella deserti]|uniref:Uncharacterized protein n=1 Tax=Kribbella deserti TaxID=1926257 RepID=A0ABV6QSS0_9ACTN